MKKLVFFAMSLMAMTLATSCGGSDNTEAAATEQNADNGKTLTVEKKTFKDGDLAEYVEIATNDCKYVMNETGGEIKTQYWIANLEIEVTSDAFKGCPVKDIEFTGWSPLQVAIFDGNGNPATPETLTLNTDEYEKLAEALTKGKGTKVTLRFDAQTNNSEDAPEWYKSVAQLKASTCGGFNLKGDFKLNTSDNEGTEPTGLEGENPEGETASQAAGYGAYDSYEATADYSMEYEAPAY